MDPLLQPFVKRGGCHALKAYLTWVSVRPNTKGCLPIQLVRGMAPACVLGAMFLLLSPHGVAAQQGGPGTVTTTATLSILAGEVTYVAAGGSQTRAARDGMDLAEGVRILTGPKATALVTFLDGSTLTIQPDSDVVIAQADIGRTSSRVRISINFGTVWARVVRLLDPGSGMSLESNTATATVHDGLIGAQQKRDAKFVCWTLAGELVVKDAEGRTLTVLNPGEKTTVKGGKATDAEPFAYNQSTLKITTPSKVFPLVLMTDKARVAGFIAPGVEVNQVFGSFTGVSPQGSYTVEVPAGKPGPFTLVLEGLEEASFSVTLTGLFQGAQVYQQQLSGSIKQGQRLVTHITHQLESGTADNPKTAIIQSGDATPLEPLKGPLPGRILLSEREVQEAGKM